MASDNKDTPKADKAESDNNPVIETDSLEMSADTVKAAPGETTVEEKPKQPGGFKKIAKKFNIYLLLFVLILVISGAVVVITAMSQKKADETKIASQAVPSDVLKQLSKTDATVGDPKQVLNVQSNAVFAGKVLVRGSLDVAGEIHVNGSLSLPGITVSGNSSLDQLQVNKTLSVGGDTSILGQLNIKKNLAVSGGGTFGGGLTAPQVTTSQLQLLGDLALSSHIVAGGAAPGRGVGGAVGGGGTSSVSGSDTAGSININTGGGPAAGCFLTVNFNTRYNNTPHVVITPVGSAAASIEYYVTRNTSSFSVCTTSTPPANSSFGFDYIVIG